MYATINTVAQLTLSTAPSYTEALWVIVMGYLTDRLIDTDIPYRHAIDRYPTGIIVRFNYRQGSSLRVQ